MRFGSHNCERELPSRGKAMISDQPDGRAPPYSKVPEKSERYPIKTGRARDIQAVGFCFLVPVNEL